MWKNKEIIEKLKEIEEFEHPPPLEENIMTMSIGEAMMWEWLGEEGKK